MQSFRLSKQFLVVLSLLLLVLTLLTSCQNASVVNPSPQPSTATLLSVPSAVTTANATATPLLTEALPTQTEAPVSSTGACFPLTKEMIEKKPPAELTDLSRFHHSWLLAISHDIEIMRSKNLIIDVYANEAKRTPAMISPGSEQVATHAIRDVMATGIDALQARSSSAWNIVRLNPDASSTMVVACAVWKFKSKVQCSETVIDRVGEDWKVTGWSWFPCPPAVATDAKP